MGEKETATAERAAKPREEESPSAEKQAPEKKDRDEYVQDNSPNAESRVGHDTAKNSIQNMR